ncbi:MAG: hypothetical protein H0W02_03115 [Ktedonobacteraceae bacterium]|nr:hypothetical protein [Ktedonobacteraceae bacterium]
MRTILEQQMTVQQHIIPGPLEQGAGYKAYFFGPFRVTRDAQPLGDPVWRRNKAKALLKWFLLHPGKMFSTDQLTSLFWPNIVRTAAGRNLHVTVNCLRHLLEPNLSPRQESQFIRHNKHHFYWFESAEDWWTDILAVYHHQTAARLAEQGNDTVQVIEHYRSIVEYCSPGFLPEDAYEDTFAAHRRHFDSIYIQSLESLIHLCSQAGMFDKVLAYAHQALLVNPYSELAARAIIDTFFQQGNITGALRKMNDFQQFLQEDLGVEPGEEMLLLRKKMIGSQATMRYPES